MTEKRKRKKRGPYKRRNTESGEVPAHEENNIRKMNRRLDAFFAARDQDSRVTKYIMFTVDVSDDRKWISKREWDAAHGGDPHKGLIATIGGNGR